MRVSVSPSALLTPFPLCLCRTLPPSLSICSCLTLWLPGIGHSALLLAPATPGLWLFTQIVIYHFTCLQMMHTCLRPVTVNKSQIRLQCTQANMLVPAQLTCLAVIRQSSRLMLCRRQPGFCPGTPFRDNLQGPCSGDCMSLGTAQLRCWVLRRMNLIGPWWSHPSSFLSHPLAGF